MEAAIQQARLGLEEGGIPIGGALVCEFNISKTHHQALITIF